MIFRCNACSAMFPAKGPYNEHIATCMGSPEEIRNYQALGAVDHSIDLTVGVEEWSLLANSFADFPPLPNLTKSANILPILIKSKQGRIKVSKAAHLIAAEVPEDLTMALGRDRLENLMRRYICLIYDKNPMAEMREVGNYSRDGRRGVGGHGIFATENIEAKTIVKVQPSHYQPIVFKSQEHLSF